MKSAREIYREMMSFDITPARSLMKRENPNLSDDEVEHAMKGLLQWLAGHAAAPHNQQAYVMLLGPVDEAFHAFILNTRLYMRFCRDHVGFFIHHTPVETELAAKLEADGSLHYTVDFLETEFGDTLSPQLRAWCDGVRSGELSATAVSCLWGQNVQEDPSILEHFGLVSIVKRWAS